MPFDSREYILSSFHRWLGVMQPNVENGPICVLWGVSRWPGMANPRGRRSPTLKHHSPVTCVEWLYSRRVRFCYMLGQTDTVRRMGRRTRGYRRREADREGQRQTER